MTNWRTGDYVYLKKANQYLVASDNPNGNTNCWLISADPEDYERVGTFMPTDYVNNNDPQLLVGSDGTPPITPFPADPATTPRSDLLHEADQLINGDRNNSYGGPIGNFTNIAALWNTQFGHMLKEGVTISPTQVAQALIQVKMARMIAQPKRDNWTDVAGYAACGWECQDWEEQS